MTGTIFDIKEMAVHDGPGIRTTVFFKGCPLSCKWCHNPEGLIKSPQLMYKKGRCTGCGKCKEKCEHEECQIYGRCIRICPENCLEISGKKVDAKELAIMLEKTADVLGDSFGGFTFSGGEPLMQPEFLLALAEHLKGYNLCMETSGYADEETFRKTVDVMDYVIMDIKLADDVLHRKYTGVSNRKIIENFQYLRLSGKPYVIRTPLIPNICDTENNLSEIKKIIEDSRWEKLPYNQMASAKYEMLGLPYPMDLPVHR